MIWTRVLPALLIVMFSFGCATRVRMNISVLPDEKIEKRDKLGEPVPVIVKIYELRSADRFNQTPIDGLFFKPEEMLKEDLVSVKKEKVDFFKKKYKKIRAGKETKFIGLVAKLQKESDNQAWKRIYVVDDKKLKTIEIGLKPLKPPGSANHRSMVLTFPSATEKEQFDEFGEPIPALVRIYQLKDLTSFNTASENDLFLQGDKILGEALAAKGQLKAYVDKILIKRVKIEAGTKFLGMVAKLYKTGDDRFWKKSFTVNSPELKSIKIVLEKDVPSSLTVALFPEPEMKLPKTFRFFSLSGVEKFKEAGFRALWLNGEEVLSGELLKIEKKNIYPGKPEKITILRNEELRYLGIAANFRKRSGERSWKKIIDFSKKSYKKAETVNLLIQRTGFEMDPVSSKNK
ncbi:MAG: type VI secretion system lipoprotein TssJ [Nitrospinota bacterium]